MIFINETVASLRQKLDKKEISARELTQSYLDEISKTDVNLDSFVTVCTETALKQAESAQKKIDGGQALPLTGIPLAIKDNICTEGVLTTCASKMLDNFIPPYSATVIEKLSAQDAVFLGKTSMDEFAMGSTTQTAFRKKTKNPYDTEKVPGGSSGGSAAAVSAGLCAASLGSDTGGSIRQPSSFCGVTGLKPTYSRVSRYGLIAFASSLDQIGPIARSAEDCGIILNAISGFDPHDGTSSKKSPEDFTAKIGAGVKGLKIGIPKEFFSDAVDTEVKEAVLKAAETYKSMGAELVDCSLPSLKFAVAAYYLISSAEAASNLARFDGIKYGHRSEKGATFNELVKNSRSEGFGREVKRRIMLGNYALSSGYYDAYYGKAMALKQRFREEYKAIFEQCDFIITPTAPNTAFRMDDNITDPAKVYLADICTVTVNIASLPAITTTCGYDKTGMPIGMSLVGNMWNEAQIIGACDAFEKTFTKISPKGGR
ncbi:MAG: Asp-tRNA(Asn)/Glu-tRNA(Gln) amidotransferase subunit GatA [Ruminococcus sp.]|jgi:aspartyl-tRNA(Asn)/glutamyl-tRNA(Gln) amidotransferase subunit A|nr:Asp-tRNA(Asn)/Glu-tRNA(Gln) amidotransferase subunit GatA [Ruminococcus sp.]